MNRRGFIGALTGLALVPLVPRVTRIDETHRQLTPFPVPDRDRLAGVLSVEEARRREELTISITCDTADFQRQLRELDREAKRIIRNEMRRSLRVRT